MDEKTIDQLVDLIFQRVRDRSWLYWPPGPMMNQVFDKEMCKKDIKRFLERLNV